MKHIASRESGPLQFSGGTLQPGEPGKAWRVMIGGSAAELSLATAAMLRRALQDKTKKLHHWNGKFSQLWLLLLSCYPLADDTAEVENTLRGLVRKNAGLAGFDGSFGSGYPDRTLIPIAFSENP